MTHTKQLIFSLKALAFRPSNKVYRRFENLKKIYEIKGQSYKNYLEYFEHTWMDGIYKIKDWNYHDKLAEFEDLAMTNNGLESFHQMIRSQLRRINPSIAGFVEVLARVETLKKLDYDQDKIKGDPQYNRCWPATRIFRELYQKEMVNKGKSSNTVKFEKSKPEKGMKDEPIDEEDVTFEDYGNVKIEKLKAENFELYSRESKKVEREVSFLFEQFEEERQSYQRDSCVRQANQWFKEIDKECKTDEAKLEGNKELGVFESYVYQDRPILMNIMENTKHVKSKILPPPVTKQHGLLEDLEGNEDM
jgi:hypothetical protein